MKWSLAFLALALAASVAHGDDSLVTDGDGGAPDLLTSIPSRGRVIYIKNDEPTVLRCMYNSTLAGGEEEDVTIEWTFVDGVHTQKFNEHGEEVGTKEAVEDENTDMGDPVDPTLIEVDDDGATSILTLRNDSMRGKYVCRAGGEHAEFLVNYYFKLERFPQSYTVMDGDDLLLPCQLRPSSVLRGNPVYRWYIKPGTLDKPTDQEGNGDVLEPDTSVVNGIEPHIKFFNSSNSTAVTVKIENAVYEDRAWYRCVVTNDFGQTDIGDSLVRVKYRYGAMYPFIGIVAEVVVLCLVIFICERRKSNKDDVAEDEEDDYNGAASGGAGGPTNSSVRQRVR